MYNRKNRIERDKAFNITISNSNKKNKDLIKIFMKWNKFTSNAKAIPSIESEERPDTQKNTD